MWLRHPTGRRRGGLSHNNNNSNNSGGKAVALGVSNVRTHNSDTTAGNGLCDQRHRTMGPAALSKAETGSRTPVPAVGGGGVFCVVGSGGVVGGSDRLCTICFRVSDLSTKLRCLRYYCRRP